MKKNFSQKIIGLMGGVIISTMLASCTNGGSSSKQGIQTVNALSNSCVNIDVIATNSWQGGFNGAVRIGNTNNSPITSFSVAFTMGGTVSGSAWNGTITGSGTYTATNPAWMQYSPVAKGSSWDVGFSGSGSLGTVNIGSVTINGVTQTAGSTSCGGTSSQTDITAPSVTLASSANTISSAGSLTLSATASDNVGVTKVEFYDGTILLGTDNSSPFSQSVAFSQTSSAQTATKNYTAKAYDAAGNVATSSSVNVGVNIPAASNPAAASISLVTSASSITSGQSATLTATPAATNTTVTNVELLSGSTVIATDSSSPYSFTVSPTTTTSYSARVNTAAGISAVSSSVPITVTSSGNSSISLSLASNPQSVTSSGSWVTLIASATASNTTISKVEFLNSSGTVLSTDTSSPYEFNTSITATSTFTAKATAANGSVASATTTVTLSSPPPAAPTQIANFGTNNTNAKMFLYVPTTLPAKPAIIVGIHWCHGDALAYYNGTKYKTVAAQYGFIVIYPQTGASDGCWDVSSKATLNHNGGGESNAIVNMVKYVVSNYNADPEKVFVTGTSSGGMMTQVLLGAYPEVFKAGSSFAGVPFGCFEGPNSWNSDCADGKITNTAQAWGDKVRAAYPGYNGARPRVQLFHGNNDTTVASINFPEAIKQWTNVLGVSQTPSTTENNVLQTGWIRTRYKDSAGVVQVEAVSEVGQGHGLVVLEDESLRFFGFIQ